MLLRHLNCTKISKTIFLKFFIKNPHCEARSAEVMLLHANNNRKAVVVYARHVAKRPSKRSALVYIYSRLRLIGSHRDQVILTRLSGEIY